MILSYLCVVTKNHKEYEKNYFVIISIFSVWDSG